MAITALHSYVNPELLGHDLWFWSTIYMKHHLRNTTVSAWEPSVSHGNQKMVMGRRSAFLNLTLTQNYNVYMTRTAGLNGAVV